MITEDQIRAALAGEVEAIVAPDPARARIGWDLELGGGMDGAPLYWQVRHYDWPTADVRPWIARYSAALEAAGLAHEIVLLPISVADYYVIRLHEAPQWLPGERYIWQVARRLRRAAERV